MLKTPVTLICSTLTPPFQSTCIVSSKKELMHNWFFMIFDKNQMELIYETIVTLTKCLEGQQEREIL